MNRIGVVRVAKVIALFLVAVVILLVVEFFLAVIGHGEESNPVSVMSRRNDGTYYAAFGLERS